MGETTRATLEFSKGSATIGRKLAATSMGLGQAVSLVTQLRCRATVKGSLSAPRLGPTVRTLVGRLNCMGVRVIHGSNMVRGLLGVAPTITLALL